MAKRADDDDADEPATVALALALLAKIAESPWVCSSHRMAARQHLRRLDRLVMEERRGAEG